MTDTTMRQVSTEHLDGTPVVLTLFALVLIALLILL